MEFTFRCPKCRGEDFRIEKDQRFFGGASADTRVFTCRCGKQLFGKQIDEEIARQEDFFKAMKPRAPNPIAVKLREERKRQDEASRLLAEKVRRRDEMFAAEREQRRLEKEQEKEEESRAQAERQHLLDEQRREESLCAWPGCGKPRKGRSKYCSRYCSNKNARAMYIQRQEAISSQAPSAGADTCACRERSTEPSESHPDPVS